MNFLITCFGFWWINSSIRGVSGQLCGWTISRGNPRNLGKLLEISVGRSIGSFFYLSGCSIGIRANTPIRMEWRANNLTVIQFPSKVHTSLFTIYIYMEQWNFFTQNRRTFCNRMNKGGGIKSSASRLFSRSKKFYISIPSGSVDKNFSAK